jgi:hypothetical protein
VLFVAVLSGVSKFASCDSIVAPFLAISSAVSQEFSVVLDAALVLACIGSVRGTKYI